MASRLIVWGGITVASLTVSAAYTLYKFLHDEELGEISIWGLTNSGKTTFINRLAGESVSGEKQQTTHEKIVDIPDSITIGDKKYKVGSLKDSPGSTDRVQRWIDSIKEMESVTILYMVNLSSLGVDKHDEYYLSVEKVVKDCAEVIYSNGKTSSQSLHLVLTHVDKSEWKDIQPAYLVDTILSESENIKRLHGFIEKKGIRSHIYAANLLDDASFDSLKDSVFKDIVHA